MLTASTYQRVPALRPDGHKTFAVLRMQAVADAMQASIAAWVVLADHYHVLIKFPRAGMLTGFTQRVHGGVSHELNLRDDVRGRRIFQNYWDTCIRDEAGFWTRFNYIHNNPVKHGYVDQPALYAHSSYGHYLSKFGAPWLSDVFARFPVLGFTEE